MLWTSLLSQYVLQCGAAASSNAEGTVRSVPCWFRAELQCHGQSPFLTPGDKGPEVCRGRTAQSYTVFLECSYLLFFLFLVNAQIFPKGLAQTAFCLLGKKKKKETAPLFQQSKQTCPFHLVFLQRSPIRSPLTTCHFLFNSACLLFYCESCLSFF